MLPIAILVLVCIGLPLAQSWRLLQLREPTRSGYLFVAADATVFVALLMLVGRWDIAGYWIRPVLLAVFGASLLWSWRKHHRLPWRADSGKPGSIRRGRRGTLASLLVFGSILVYVLFGLAPSAPARELAFPLEGGRFIVGQGGANPLLNHHAGHRQQRHAVDIVALNPLGFRASGLLPEQLATHGPATACRFASTTGPPCATGCSRVWTLRADRRSVQSELSASPATCGPAMAYRFASTSGMASGAFLRDEPRRVAWRAARVPLEEAT